MNMNNTYFCQVCKRNHLFTSKIGQQHNKRFVRGASTKIDKNKFPVQLRDKQPYECAIVQMYDDPVNEIVNDYLIWYDNNGQLHYQLYGANKTSKELKSNDLTQPEKGKTPTMIKSLPQNIQDSFISLVKDQKREHSFMVDFERPGEQPQRTVAMEGGSTSTGGNYDFEMFGHSHPGVINPDPSTGDLYNMRLLYPEFIIAGKSGKVYFFNIDDKERFVGWKTNVRYRQQESSDLPISNVDIDFIATSNKYKSNKDILKINNKNLLEYEVGRDIFRDITGIRVYPYVPKQIELRDDPKLDKQVPTIEPTLLKKYKKEMR